MKFTVGYMFQTLEVYATERKLKRGNFGEGSVSYFGMRIGDQAVIISF